MPDILVRRLPGELKRQLEEWARAHDRNLSQELTALLQIALERSEPAEIQGAEVGLGTLLATTFPKQHDYDDFVPPPRNGPHRPGPDFDQPTPNIALDAPQKPPAKRRERATPSPALRDKDEVRRKGLL